MSNEFFKSVKHTEHLTQENNLLLQQQSGALRGIQFTSAVSAVAGTVTAVQSFKQVQLQQEQLLVQQAMHQQQMIHQFAMWRQTPDGQFFISWQARAVELLTFLRYRNHLWAEEWNRTVITAQQSIPAHEAKDYLDRPKKLRRSGLKTTGIILIVLGFLMALGLVPVSFSTLNNLPGDAGASGAALVGFLLGLPYAIPLLSGIGMLILRSFLIRSTKNDSRVDDAKRKRMSQWGFDPLDATPGYVGFGWWDENWMNLQDYMNHMEHFVVTGYQSYPSPETLPVLSLPSLRGNTIHANTNLDNLMSRFRQEELYLKSAED